MTGLVSIAEPVNALLSLAERREAARQAIRQAWPHAPDCLSATLTRVLLNDRATPDVLLFVADGLDEARREASAGGHLMEAQGLERLRDVFRDAAPLRHTEGERS